MEQFELGTKLDGLNVILVTGEGCASCVSMVNVINNLSDKFKQINFFILNLEEKFIDFLNQYEIRTIPSVLVIKNNKLVDKCNGYQPDEILEIWLDSKLSE